MSVFSIAFILSALFTGKCLLGRIKRLDGVIAGAIFVIINVFGLGALYLVQGKSQIIALSVFFQMTGGIGNGLCTTSALAIISSYKKERQTYVGYFEIVSGLGSLLGPVLGSGFNLIGDAGPFFGIGGLYSLALLGSLIAKGSIVQNQDSQAQKLISEEQI